MKIENFQLRMQSKYTHETSQSTTFELELQHEQETQNIQAKHNALTFEKWFHSKMQLLLLQQLLRHLSGVLSKEVPTIALSDTPAANKATSTVTQTHYEHQALHVQMQGYVQTQNARIAINLEANISHTLVNTQELKSSGFIDPLVINYAGELPQLDDMTFSFDIDNDGTSDQISMLQQGNGFLALDRNENGTIDNGSELFGTQMGNGFAELGLFDSDNNLWIDENDPILDQLRIWSRDAQGEHLVALGELGIGAIYLGHTSSTFTYKNSSADTGRLRSSGLFLYENGAVGTVAQLDFAKQKSASQSTKNTLLQQLLASNDSAYRQ